MNVVCQPSEITLCVSLTFLGCILPLPYIVLSLTNNKYLFVPSLYPYAYCVSKRTDLNFYYFNGFGFMLPVISTALLLISLINLAHFQKASYCVLITH